MGEQARPSSDRSAQLLDTFMEFPVPLALLDTSGRIELANESFRRDFGESAANKTCLAALRNAAQDRWQYLDLPLTHVEGTQVSARAVRMTHYVLLIADQALGRDRDRELDELRRRLTDLARLAATDHLTGVWNRAHLEHVIDFELARSLETQQPIALILFDVDEFKHINDQFGHALGDRVLRDMAQAVKANLRASDLLFRWGGEEFIVLVSSAGYRRAERVAENIRRIVEEHAFERVGGVTISLGVAEHDSGEALQAWFDRLDAAMYRAKAAGRNRVVVDRRGNSDRWGMTAAGSPLHLIWQEAYECGNAQIDGEHRELFRLANEVIDASLRTPASLVDMTAALGELIAHVQQHFTHEEEILARLDYREFEEHQRAHAGLIRRALQMQSMLGKGETSVGALVEFLAQDVVARHLLGVDRAFFPLFGGGVVGLPDGDELASERSG